MWRADAAEGRVLGKDFAGAEVAEAFADTGN
jgi:hypothetical protein